MCRVKKTFLRVPWICGAFFRKNTTTSLSHKPRYLPQSLTFFLYCFFRSCDWTSWDECNTNQEYVQTKLNVDSSVEIQINLCLKTPKPLYLTCVSWLFLFHFLAQQWLLALPTFMDLLTTIIIINVCKWKLTTVVSSSDRFPKSFDFHSFLSSFKYFF